MGSTPNAAPARTPACESSTNRTRPRTWRRPRARSASSPGRRCGSSAGSSSSPAARWPGTPRSARSSPSRRATSVAVTPSDGWRADVGRHRRLARRPDRHHPAGRRAVARLRAPADGSRARAARSSTSWSGPARCARTARSSGCAGLVVDISDRHLVESNLRELIDRYRRLVDLSPDGIVVHQSGRIVYANRSGLECVGAHERRAGARPLDHRLRPPRLARPHARTHRPALRRRPRSPSPPRPR